MIEPDEAQGPAQFFLQRLAQNNPKIDLSRPIPIKKLSDEIQRLRSGGDFGRGGPPPTSSQPKEPQLLVPDFRLESEPIPPPGFSAVADDDKFNVKVEDRDIAEAEERMRRYDRDRDGALSKEELGQGRWSDDPMQYDRNRDGKLTVNELAIRYANRRVAEEQRRAASGDREGGRSRSPWASRGGDDGWRRSAAEDKKDLRKERFGDAKSYRLTSSGSQASGLPSFFAAKDADGDGQVMMHEFSTAWNAEVLAEYLKWDLNSDGVITAKECIAAVNAGQRGGTVAASSPTGASTSGAASGSSASSGLSAQIDPVLMDWAKRQISKYDTNNDGQLTPAEWEKMLIKPVGADADGDGVITATEYAAFRAKKK